MQIKGEYTRLMRYNDCLLINNAQKLNNTKIDSGSRAETSTMIRLRRNPKPFVDSKHQKQASIERSRRQIS